MLNLGRCEDFVESGQVGVVGFVAAADNDGDIGLWERINGHASG